MFEITIKGHIAAAHFLTGYPGKCQHLHGHTWDIQITILQSSLDELGMVHDFADLKKRFSLYLDRFDHKCLNECEEFKSVIPSTENLAKVIYQGFSKEIPSLRLAKVQVWESDRASATYYE